MRNALLGGKELTRTKRSLELQNDEPKASQKHQYCIVIPAFITNAALALALIIKTGVDTLKARTIKKVAGFDVEPIDEQTLKKISYNLSKDMKEGVELLPQGKMTQQFFAQETSSIKHKWIEQ